MSHTVAEALRTAIDGPEQVNAAPVDSRLWEAVRLLTLRVPTVGDVRAHRLEPLAVAYWPDAGRPVPVEMAGRVGNGRKIALAAPLLLERIRAACHGPLVLMKGPEVAACYERPRLRPYADLDLLAPDAHAVQRDLVRAGLVPVGDERLYVDIHHLRPLHLRGFPLVVEVHSRPKWVDGLAPPSAEELVDAAVPSATGVDCILAPARTHHAMLLAAHAWAHQPLGLLGQLIDLAAVRQGLPDAELRSVAERLGIGRLWEITARTLDALFLGGASPWPLRVWARNLPRARERTMLELHLERWLAGFSVFPTGHAVGLAGRAVSADFRREPGEGWGRKVRRSSLSVRHALRRQSVHDAEVEERYGRRDTTLSPRKRADR